MKIFKKIIYSLIVALAITNMSFMCSKPTEDVCKNAICTEELRNIKVTIVPLSMPPQINVQGVVVRDENGLALLTNNTPLPGSNNYVILDDGDMFRLSAINKTKVFTVEVLRNNTIIATKKFNIGKDCCHIYLQDTDNTITIP